MWRFSSLPHTLSWCFQGQPLPLPYKGVLLIMNVHSLTINCLLRGSKVRHSENKSLPLSKSHPPSIIQPVILRSILMLSYLLFQIIASGPLSSTFQGQLILLLNPCSPPHNTDTVFLPFPTYKLSFLPHSFIYQVSVSGCPFFVIF